MRSLFPEQKCSLQLDCPGPFWRSPLVHRCIANERLVNPTPVCCTEKAGGPTPWRMPSLPVFFFYTSFPSVSTSPFFCSPEESFSVSISIRQFALSFLHFALLLNHTFLQLCPVVLGCLAEAALSTWKRHTSEKSSLEGVSLTPDWFLSMAQVAEF